MTIKEYIDKLNNLYKRGTTTEHSFRGELQILIESLVPVVQATNEPRRGDFGAPDYVITQGTVPIGYIEAKDIDKDLSNKKYKEQFERYRNGLENLIITNYISFEFYEQGEFVTSIYIAEISNNAVIPLNANFDTFAQLIHDFCNYRGQTIRSAKTLAKMMAAKARLMAHSLEKSIEDDITNDDQSELWSQYETFKRVLIDTITHREFADVYAQTIAYGMFAARLHDTTLDTFSRIEAATLIPHSNPFLRKMFQFIAGYDLDSRIAWIVDALAQVFRFTDVASILNNFGKATQQHDPIIHFYETFLSEYDPKLRKSRGVWYTPEPVVSFIVRAVDDVLKADFDITDGLASRDKIQVERAIEQSRDKRFKDNAKKQLRTFDKVQVLDPATGTGTFLAEVIKLIYQGFENNKGMWNGYVKQHLIPRINGFELLMASYAMAHLKMDLLFDQTGYKPTDNQRFNIFLTNSLEESHPYTGTMFASWLSDEANDANRVKRDTPVMCVIGNPPYSGESQNKGEWIMRLMDDYKKEPNTTQRLKERNPKWINDDYVKFIRYAQHYVEKNGSGIVAYINPHGYLDNPTFRGMRWNLLKTFDKIFVIDLHGNAKKKETAPDGSKDENVFDIMQGVSINLFVKTGKKHVNELGKVYHIDLYGKREDKYRFLLENSLSTIEFTEVENRPPMYFFVQKDLEGESKYQKGFSINDLFPVNGVGITTAHDQFVINDSKKELIQKFEKFQREQPIPSLLYKEFNVKTKKGWDILEGWNNIQSKDISTYIEPIVYRPFDNKYIFYEDKLVWRTVKKIMRHFIEGENVGLIFRRQQLPERQTYYFITKYIVADGYIRSDSKGGESIAPLYLYPDPEKPDAFSDGKRKPNLKGDIVHQISKKLKLAFVDEEGTETDLPKGYKGTFAPIHLLDYIYAVLHSPTYRDTYKEFLKTDFPRVPYPKDADSFLELAALGKQIRQLHLMEVKKPAKVGYPVEGNNVVERFIFEPNADDAALGCVWINADQYFSNVPLKAWEFYIGGYQPAQKWLKDRKDRILSFDDILHYQRIINALIETDRLMHEVDKVLAL